MSSSKKVREPVYCLTWPSDEDPTCESLHGLICGTADLLKMASPHFRLCRQVTCGSNIKAAASPTRNYAKPTPRPSCS